MTLSKIMLLVSTSHRQEEKVYKGMSNEMEMLKAVQLQCGAIVSRMTTSRTVLSCLQTLNCFPGEKRKKSTKKNKKGSSAKSKSCQSLVDIATLVDRACGCLGKTERSLEILSASWLLYEQHLVSCSRMHRAEYRPRYRH